MPRYLTQHTLACLTRQGAEKLAERMMSGGNRASRPGARQHARGQDVRRVPRRIARSAGGWLKAEGMHFDWLVRVEWETRAQDGKLHIAE